MLKVQTTPITYKKPVEAKTKIIPTPLEYSTKLAETVAIIQNSINEEERKLANAAMAFSKSMFNEDQMAVNSKMVEIAVMKGKIQAYKDCSEFILENMQ